MPEWWRWDIAFAVAVGFWGHWLYMYVLSWVDQPYRWRCPYCMGDKKDFNIKLSDRHLRDHLKRAHVKEYHPERWPFYAEPD